MPADPCLGKSSFHCDACRCWLKEHLLLRPQPCVQSSFHGKVFCFDAFMEDGHCECSIPLYVFSDISYQGLFTSGCSRKEFQFVQVTGPHCSHTHFTVECSSQIYCVNSASKRLIKSVEESLQSVL